MPVKFIAFALSIKPLQVQNVLRIHKKKWVQIIRR